MSTPRRVTRQSTSNTPSSSKGGQLSSPAKGKIIVVNDSTPTRPAKRARTTTSTPQGGQAASSPIRQRSSPRKQASRGGRSGAISVREDGTEEEEGDDDATSGSEASSLGHGLISTLAKNASAATGKGFVHRNAFDAYFAAASKPSRTSNNVFSDLVAPLSRDEYTTLLANSEAASKHAAKLEQVLKGYEVLFPRYAFELAEGFNLLFFGFGSKRTVLNNFARSVCARRGHVVMVNGYMPRVGIKEVITTIEGVPGLADVPLPPSATGIEAQTRRIYEFFLPQSVRPQHPTSERPLFLFIHNIDSPSLRTPKAKAILSLLALNPCIHLVGSVDHINAQMIWSTAEASTRKHSYVEESPYDAELAHVDINSIRKKRGKAAATDSDMSESAAQHILASVNAKAKKLFVLLANTLLTSFDESGAGGKKKEKQPQMQLQQHAVSYETLFNAARTDFIATSDTSFKALLAEFRDHGLVLTLASGGGESLWIPLRVEELRRVVASIAGEQ
ncbi:origin recognition complex subunit 2-domain-containing protein [Gautieria morchelliformis]|nr:origin recognition complex subunit 2-domain-containing protein [Gautieria morchelliformis]